MYISRDHDVHRRSLAELATQITVHRIKQNSVTTTESFLELGDVGVAPSFSAAMNGCIALSRVIAADIKLAHSIFALPFALLAAFMAATSAYATIDWNRFVVQLILVALAMVFGRTVAMVSNRFFDRHIDALNPRTAGRALPSGRLSRDAALGSIALASAGFLLV